jgi:putative xylitol transport system substrate-binding protein
MKKKLTLGILSAFIAFGLTTALFATGQSEQSTSVKKVYRIAAAVYGEKAEYMRLWTTALEHHPAVKSGMVKITVFDGNYDAATQVNQFQTIASQGYDGAIFVPIDVNAGAAAVDIAAAAHIPVVGSNTRVNSDKLYSYIGSDDVKAGELEAQYVVNKMGGKGNLVIIEGPIGQSAQIERREGNLNVLKKYPNVKMLAMKTANWSRNEALNVMQNWLTAFPNQINGVIGQNDEMALGAIQAIKQSGLDLHSFAIAGIDGVTDALKADKAGEMQTTLQDATGQSQGALDLVLRAIIGSSYTPQAEVWKKMNWDGGTEKIYNVPWVPVDASNVDQILAAREALTTR